MQFWDDHRLAKATKGQWHGQLLWMGARIITDTRIVAGNDIFLAIRGERFDAHDFALEAQQRGACALIVDHVLTSPEITIPQLVVMDTKLALGDLARTYRAQFLQLRVAALTGSSGKTTTKEMLGSILSLQGETLITRGNLNNDLGVPMMLLELTTNHQFAVIELGASHIGEIDYTAHMAKPEVAAVLNIGTAHIGEFGGREGIARAKSEIFGALPPTGIAVIPQQDDFAQVLFEASQSHTQIRFGTDGEVYATDILLEAQHSQFTLHTPQGSMQVTMAFVGMHNISNALAAVAMAQALGIPLKIIVLGLSQAQSAKGRLNFITAPFGLLIDDTYNANPHSMQAAAKVLSLQTGYRIMVLGDMAELGDSAAAQHQELGQILAQMDVNQFYAVGAYALNYAAGAQQVGKTMVTFESKQQLQAQLAEDIRHAVTEYGTVTVLLKGSRTAAMETLMPTLMEVAAC